MSALVTPGIPGRRQFFRQRRVEAPPYTNCRLVVACSQLVFGGLRIPDRERLVRTLRRATGVPEVGPSGAQGTTAADVLRAIDQVLPWVQAEARLYTDTELLRGLESGAFTAGVSVPVYNALPGRLARWSPGFDRGHQIWLAAARHVDETPEVLWYDVLGVAPYRGEWVRFATVKRHLSQAGGRVFATTIRKGAAMSTAMVLDHVLPAGTTATLRTGTPRWSFDAERLALVPDKPQPARETVPADTIVRVLQQPQGPDRPRGRFLRIAGTPRYVRIEDVTIKQPVPAQPVDVDAVRAAAFAEGQAVGEAAALERFSLVDEPLYRQVVGEIS
jgi:hypothetical protein